MTIYNAEDYPQEKIQIDLNGSDGNAFVLMGIARNLCDQLGWDKTEIIKEMTAGDYEDLVYTFDSKFGDFVDIYR